MPSHWKHLFGRKGTAAAIVPETKASAANSLMTAYSAHQPRFTPRQYDQLAAEGYQKNVIAYRCIRLISQSAAAVPWVVYKRENGQRTRLQTHPLIDLLRQPNALQGATEFFSAVYGFYLIAGNSYIEAVRPQHAPPGELWPLRPDRVRVIPGRHGMPGAYRYQATGSHVDFAVNELTGQSPVLHLKSFHPLDDWYGMSPLEAAAISIDQHNDAATWNASLLQSSGRPSGALVYRPGNDAASQSLSDDQRRSLREDIAHFFSGSNAAGTPLVLEGGLDWKEMSLNPKDMDWLAGKDVSAREIALAFHVPPQLIGVEGSLTFANFEQSRLALYDDAVLPLVGLLRDELNYWLTPLYGDDIELDMDLDGVEALSYRREKLWSRIKDANFMTLNEKRQALGLSELPDGDTLATGGIA